MIEQLVDQVSSYASDIDGVIILIGWFCAVWFVLAEVVFFGFCFFFRRKEGKKALYVSGEQPNEKKWIFWPHIAVLVCDVFIIFAAVRVWVDVKQTLPPMEKEIRLLKETLKQNGIELSKKVAVNPIISKGSSLNPD